MGKADAQVAGLREPFDLTYLSCIIDSCNLVSGMIERQLRHSMRCLCTEKQHMLDTSWKENTKPEESALPSTSAAQHSGQTQKGSPRRPPRCSWTLVRLWVILLPTQGKRNILCWETPRSRGTETGFFTASRDRAQRGHSRRTLYPEKHQLNILIFVLGCGFFKG